MDRYAPILEEAIYAFQDPRVLAAVAEITALEGMEPDGNLYAGGISAMGQGAYLRPHLDNSHDASRERYRVLNLLYYVTPGWEEADGGCLQLWDAGPKGPARTIASRFNRLVLMATDRHSWHSVNQVVAPGVRRCVSNYYFSAQPPEAQPYFHATSFRAEHGRGLADLAMRLDNGLRTAVLKLTGETLYRNPHRYERNGD
jgi:Rps23 Pro-64 3,4-dihydroxylase Tpa1-like proline 4-hydroxylase